jgi:hypothetical protein
LGQRVHVGRLAVVLVVPVADEVHQLGVLQVGFPLQVEQRLVAIELEQAGFMERDVGGDAVGVIERLEVPLC